MPTEAADKTTADAAAKAAADTATADKAASDKAAADTIAANKAAADKATADAAVAGKKSEGGEAAKDDDNTGAVGAPEKYALKIPEGGMIAVKEVAAFEKLAREANLTNEAAQAEIDRANEQRIEYSTALAESLKADPEYGGDKLAETQRLARSIIDRVRPEGHKRREAFLEILDGTGHGNHIEIASFLADLGKMTAEDGPIAGGSGGGGEKPLANRMYPNQV